MDSPRTPSPSLCKKDDEFQRNSSDEELAQSRVRRESVHYKTIGDFLASLKNVQDNALCLEDYLRAVNCPKQQPPGEGDPVKDRGEQAKD